MKENKKAKVPETAGQGGEGRAERELTLHESLAVWVTCEYIKSHPERKTGLVKGQADGALRTVLLEAIEWHEKADATEFSASPYYPLIKAQYEKCLEAVKTEEFWHQSSGRIRERLMDFTADDQQLH